MTEQEERHRITTVNNVRLQMAASVLREVLLGAEYGVSLEQLQAITKPLAEQIARMLADPEDEGAAR